MLRKIKDWLKPDKSLHIILSALITVLVFGLSKSLFFSAMVPIGIGILKELVWDRFMGKGVYSIQDVVADITGTALAVASIVYILFTLGI